MMIKTEVHWPSLRRLTDLEVDDLVRGSVVVLILSSQLFAACAVPSDPHSGIGVESEGSSGRVGISYLRCSGEKVTSVEVATDPSNGSGKTVWRISSGPTASEPTQFFLGETPPGWKASVSMQALPPKSEKLNVSIETTKRSPGGISLSLADLKPGMIFSDDGSVSHETFAGYQDHC
ncbi:MAG: hypothetical protein HHJ11_16335 [Phycicoccus sp.]|nr:hypothetical protein [Phycicoccus sp.]